MGSGQNEADESSQNATAEAEDSASGTEKVCQCRTCTDIRRWKSALDIRTPEAQQAFEEMLCELEATGTDLSWYRAVHEGTWPDSVEILERALKVAREVAEPVYAETESE